MNGDLTDLLNKYSFYIACNLKENILYARCNSKEELESLIKEYPDIFSNKNIDICEVKVKSRTHKIGSINVS